MLYKLQLRRDYSSEECNFLREQVNQSLRGAEAQRLSDVCEFLLEVRVQPRQTVRLAFSSNSHFLLAFFYELTYTVTVSDKQ